MSQAIDVSWGRLALLGLLVALLLALSLALKVGLARKLGVASLRGTIQLIAVGYILTAVFSLERVELILGTLLIMLAVAARTAASRMSRKLAGMSWLAAAALATGTALSLAFSTQVVVAVEPWYSPQYLIPIGGMLLGNSMNGVSLAGERFLEEIETRKDEVETLLALGFSGPEALHPLLVRSLRAAMIPTLNSLTVAGVVQLPGMMTGQILGGVSPIVAVKYQLIIFFALATSVTVATLLFLLGVRRNMLTSAHQLRPLPPRRGGGPSFGGGAGRGGGRRRQPSS